MRNHTSLSLLIALLLLRPWRAQVRFQPPAVLPARHSPLQLRESRYRIAIADSVRRETRWKDGLLVGVGIGVVLGVVSVFAPPLGDSRGASTGERIYDGFLVAGIVGVPLGVIGAMIGDASKK
ncbi:MAG: hypothetical protein IPO52_01395 [Gemmatimonadetes bacterium]|nr:hypothetical protein [Gemmatimonadota bacterium]